MSDGIRDIVGKALFGWTWTSVQKDMGGVAVDGVLKALADNRYAITKVE